MNYHKIEKTSVANGTGVRVVLWVSGCSLHCRGCHNPETWSLDSGKPFDEAAKIELFEALDKPYIQGVTFSGGHPLEPENVEVVYNLILEIKERFPDKDIWLYTGYTFNYIFNRITTDDLNFERDKIINYQMQVVQMCDVIVDGAYVEKLRDITLKWRGSSNQRVISVPETLKQNKIVTIQN